MPFEISVKFKELKVFVFGPKQAQRARLKIRVGGSTNLLECDAGGTGLDLGSNVGSMT
jgi:hypothetical protein